ncbi:hypothetical protein VKT23_002289 [Stygiomarasmius scandens]|uniref:CUE domain-containing protein n=1 Tax=Marasmiellus scandens TaxID=2682957 RepID=A0ABR1K1Y9_9AGAR
MTSDNTTTTTPAVNPFESSTDSVQAVSRETTSPSPVTTPPIVTDSSSTPHHSSDSTPPQATSPGIQQQDRNGPIDPKVSALRAMFPDFDDAVLISVLDSVGGDQDRAIDVLLGMNDPDYHSELPPQEPVLSQTELDERLARQLYLEDEQRQQQRQAAWEAQQRPQGRWGPNTGSQSSTNTGERDTMTEFGEQFNKFAETGKKTLGNIFSRVKAKIQEFDQPRPNQGTPSTSNLNNSGAESQGQYQSQSHQQHQQPAYYDPNPQAQSSPPPNSTAAAQGYDATPSPSVAVESNGVSEIPRPPATGSGSGIDTGKLGLLPKRPVSLLRPDNPSSQTQSQTRRDDDDDDLEYAENPFEEGRK